MQRMRLLSRRQPGGGEQRLADHLAAIKRPGRIELLAATAEARRPDPIERGEVPCAESWFRQTRINPLPCR